MSLRRVMQGDWDGTVNTKLLSSTINGMNLLDAVIMSGTLNHTIREISDKYMAPSTTSPYYLALTLNNLEAFQLLLDVDFPIQHSDNSSVLLATIVHHKYDLARQLLKRGASIYQRCGVKNVTTVEHVAIQQDEEGQLLLIGASLIVCRRFRFSSKHESVKHTAKNRLAVFSIVGGRRCSRISMLPTELLKLVKSFLI